jgi:hypothetical protein
VKKIYIKVIYINKNLKTNNHLKKFITSVQLILQINKKIQKSKLLKTHNKNLNTLIIIYIFLYKTYYIYYYMEIIFIKIYDTFYYNKKISFSFF